MRRKKHAYPLDLLEVTIDSKEPIILGKGKNETSDDVFDYTSASCLNVTATFRNKSDCFPENIFFDVISENRDHNSYAQKCHVKKVFNHYRFKQIAISKKFIDFRFDNASHFISEEFAFFILKTVPTIFQHFERIGFFLFPQDMEKHQR